MTAVAQLRRTGAGGVTHGRPGTLLGRLPVLALTSALGLLAVAVANAIATHDPGSALPVWWSGLLLMWVPVAWRLWGRSVRPTERACLVVLLGICLYLVQLYISPGEFRDPDEFSHLRTLDDLTSTGRLFAYNPLLLISPAYPGLETATAAAGIASGLPAVVVGPVLIVTARIVLMLALFRLVWQTFGSARIAGLGVALYTTNASFLMFDSVWSYESLALPLAVAALWSVHAWWRGGGDRPLNLAIATLSIAAVAVTHHLTSLVLTMLLIVWAVVAVVRRGPHRPRPLVRAAIWAAVVNALWLVTSGRAALAYLGDIVGDAVGALVGLTAGGTGGRPLFGARGAWSVPLPEVALTWVGHAVLILVLACCAVHVLRRHRRDPLVLVFLAAAALYPVTLAMRLTGAGAETSQRASEFLFLGIAPIVADGLVHARRRLTRYPIAVALVLVLMLAAGVILGTVWYLRLRGPYRVAAEQLSVESQGIAAAQWSREFLGPGRRFIADRTNQKLFASYGGQEPVTAYNEGIGTAYAMWDPVFSEADLEVLRRGAVEFVIIDLRTTRDPPLFSIYYERTEPESGEHDSPWPLAGLQKFDGLDGARRIFDSGDIVVYDVRGLVDADH